MKAMPSSFPLPFHQANPHGIVKGLDGNVGNVRSKTLKRNFAPEAPARTTQTPTELAVDAAAYLHLPPDNMMLSSKMARILAIKGRRSEESGCDDGAASISVSSTAFPLMEGCLLADVTNGEIVYKAETAIIISVHSTGTAEVRVLRGMPSTVRSRHPQNAALQHEMCR